MQFRFGKTVGRGVTAYHRWTQIAYWQQETTEGVLVRRMEPNIPLGGLVDLNRQIRKAQIGGMLEPEEFLQLLDVLVACRRIFSLFFGTKKNL